MNYDYKEKKIVAVIASNIEIGIAMNVLGHLALAIGHNIEKEAMGQNPLTDASNVEHLGISKYPFITTKVKQGKLSALIEQVKQNKKLLVADYPKEMLETGHDNELAEALLNKENNKIEYLGFIIYGNANDVNEITGKFQLYNSIN